MKIRKWHRASQLIYCLNDQGSNHITAYFDAYSGAAVKEAEEAAELARKAPQLMEACKKALSCASLPDSVRDVIKSAMAGTLEI